MPTTERRISLLSPARAVPSAENGATLPKDPARLLPDYGRNRLARPRDLGGFAVFAARECGSRPSIRRHRRLDIGNI
jgi:hypothetical protein